MTNACCESHAEGRNPDARRFRKRVSTFRPIQPSPPPPLLAATTLPRGSGRRIFIRRGQADPERRINLALRSRDHAGPSTPRKARSSPHPRYFSFSLSGIARRDIELERRQKRRTETGTLRSALSRNAAVSLCASLSLSLFLAQRRPFPSRSRAYPLDAKRRNLISMKRALGDFIRATSHPNTPSPRAGRSLDRLSSLPSARTPRGRKLFAGSSRNSSQLLGYRKIIEECLAFQLRCA